MATVLDVRYFGAIVVRQPGYPQVLKELLQERIIRHHATGAHEVIVLAQMPETGEEAGAAAVGVGGKRQWQVTGASAGASTLSAMETELLEMDDRVKRRRTELDDLRVKVGVELRRWVNEDPLPGVACVWTALSSLEGRYPLIVPYARRFLTIEAASTTSERNWSAVGLSLTRHEHR